MLHAGICITENTPDSGRSRSGCQEEETVRQRMGTLSGTGHSTASVSEAEIVYPLAEVEEEMGRTSESLRQ